MEENYLKETKFLNFNHPSFDEFLSKFDKTGTDKEIAIRLYYFIRDYFIYNPYHLNISETGLIASNVLKKRQAWCVEKSSVMAACARKFGIPSRLGYAIVTNHIGVDKLIQYLQRDEIVFHGYVELFIDNQWVKCTPTFDYRICAIANVTPLDWDAENDSMFQEYEGNKKFMEYLHYYGDFDDVPIDLMNEEMKKYYPHLFENEFNSKDFSFIHQ